MKGFSILKNVFDKIIDTGLTSRVFHSVQKYTDDSGNSYPVYPQGESELIYVGIDDSKLFTVYCRQIDDLRTPVFDVVGGCGVKSYKAIVPYRIVIFNDYEKRNQEDLLRKVMQFVFMPGVKLIRLITDKAKLSGYEGTAKGFVFGDETFFAAIDFEITFNLSRESCEVEFTCGKVANPYCK